MASSDETIDSLSEFSEFNLERVLPNDERTKFLFQEHAVSYTHLTLPTKRIV